ncbi:hypothetical protein AVEN_212440-1 [Araneus ventricosus]|uniref:Uncharacterized protein n=1 Tax=Araneus ventricosus TaxID=182803 RepID=A0A4Y2SML2_ARAVE|nr:hypothetical protein AVEN_212440-1 [Araneus ventricosus]
MQRLFWRQFTSSTRWRYRLGLAELAASLLVRYPGVEVRITSVKAYMPESDIKFYFTSVLPRRFPVRHLLEPETKVTRTPQTSRTQPVKGC